MADRSVAGAVSRLQQVIATRRPRRSSAHQSRSPRGTALRWATDTRASSWRTRVSAWPRLFFG